MWLQWALTHLPHDYLIAVIQPANVSSITLAEGLGFTFDRHDVTPRGEKVSIYRLDRRQPEHVDAGASPPSTALPSSAPDAARDERAHSAVP